MCVNNATTAGVYETNCAVCTIAGLLNLKYSDVANDLITKIGKNNHIIDKDNVASLFTEYDDPTNTNPGVRDQMSGMMTYLETNGAKEVEPIGYNAMTFVQMKQWMAGKSDGTKFVVCVAEVSGNDIKVKGAHWIGAVKTNGRIIFKDFQTDILPSYKARITRLDKNRGAQLGGVSETDGPMRAFRTPAAVGDKAFAFSFRL